MSDTNRLARIMDKCVLATKLMYKNTDNVKATNKFTQYTGMIKINIEYLDRMTGQTVLVPYFVSKQAYKTDSGCTEYINMLSDLIADIRGWERAE